jgi:hypothetical protein
VREIAEKRERGERENLEQYERAIQKIREQEVAEEQQAKRQAEERYAREHPSPPSSPPALPEVTLTLAEAHADVEAFIRNLSGLAPHHLKDRCHIAEPGNREAECNATWFTDARVTKHTVEYTGVFRIEKFYFVALHITFVGHRHQVGCTSRHSRKPCFSTVYW